MLVFKVLGLENLVCLVWEDDDVFGDEFGKVLLDLGEGLAECVLDDLTVLLFDLWCFGVVYLVLQIVYHGN